MPGLLWITAARSISTSRPGCPLCSFSHRGSHQPPVRGCTSLLGSAPSDNEQLSPQQAPLSNLQTQVPTCRRTSPVLTISPSRAPPGLRFGRGLRRQDHLRCFRKGQRRCRLTCSALSVGLESSRHSTRLVSPCHPRPLLSSGVQPLVVPAGRETSLLVGRAF